MGRSNASIGDNRSEPLTDDDKAALQLYYSRGIRAAEAEAATKKAEYDQAKKAVNGKFALVKGELGISRKDFEEVLALEDLSESEFILKEAERNKRLSLHGLPVGAQLDMFGSGDTVDEMARAEADGKRAGRRGDHGIPPDYISPVCIQAWMRGWTEEQSIIVMRLGRAEAIIAEREAADAQPDAEDEDDADDEVEEIDPAAAARALKRSGFMEPGPITAEAELADA
ncbi:MAG: hypothetical protein JWQ16_2473 [Novosphingobium sp.]|nr:hypothetical protein [Novosphingobium sp.]